jgi:hypothetical protein
MDSAVFQVRLLHMTGTCHAIEMRLSESGPLDDLDRGFDVVTA